MKKIAFWGPYTGHVGTIKAQVNSAYALRKYGGYDVCLIRAHSEFTGMEESLADKGLNLLDLGLSRYFPGLETSKLFARRPYMLVAALFGFIPLVRLIRRERPDVLVLNLLVAPAIVAAMISSVPLTVMVSVQGYPHFLGVEGEEPPLWKRIENGIRKWLWSRIYPKADYVLTMTEQTRRKLERSGFLSPEKLRVIHNPVVDDLMLSCAREEVNHAWYGTNRPIIVGMGRLTYQKGFDVLVHAFAKIIEAGLDCRLVIIGEGEDRRKLENMLDELHINEFVDLMGHKDNPYPYLANADLFVLSSRWEDPGHAIIEAAALEIPIVTTDCPSGPSDLVDQGAGGWVCRNGDVDDMAKKIINALNNPDEQMQKRAKLNANKYTLLSHFKELDVLLSKNDMRASP